MIIKEIIIDGFGIFSNFRINNLASGINIISGRNEAGKSTLLKFIRYTLFGYPRLTEQRMKPGGGDHGGKIKVLMASGEEVLLDRTGKDHLTFFVGDVPSQDKSQWAGLLGNADDMLFNNIYAFSLDELIGLGSFTESRLSDRLFSLGSGLGNISLGEISGSLQKTIDSIYSPKGKIQKIPVLLKEIEDKESLLEPVESSISKYNELQERLMNLGSEITVLEAEIKNALAEQNKFEDYLRCYESYVAISAIDDELSTLPECVDYPDDGLKKLAEDELKEKALEERIRDLQQGTEEETGISDLEIKIERLAFNNALLAKKSEMDHLRENLKLHIQTISDKIELSVTLSDLNKHIQRSLKDINSQWTEEHISGLNDLRVHQDRIKAFKSDFEQIKTERLESETLLKAQLAGKRIINTRNVVKLLSLIMLLGSLPFFFYNLLVAGIVMVIIAIVLFSGSNFVLEKDPDQSVKQKIGILDENENILQKTYGSYVSGSLHLNEKLTPDSMLEILLSINDLKKKIAERDSVKEKFEAKEKSILDFESIVSEFSDIITFNSIDTISRVNQILDEYSHDKEVSDTKTSLDNELEKKKRGLLKTVNELKIIREHIESTVGSILAVSREDYKAKYAVNNRVIVLKAARKQAILTISTIAGLEKVNGVIDYLKNNDQNSIKQRLNEKSDELKEMNDMLGAKKEERGSVGKEISQLEKKGNVAEILTGIESDKEKLVIEYQAWLANKIALKVLSEVKSKFEKEKQPVVIRNSSRHFRKITGEKFDRITSPMDAVGITVFDTNENAKQIDQLSRGTREQLLLSLRLGFIEEYEKHSEPLPLVVDEIFVNFDPDRTKKTAEIFSDFAKGRQVIIFTCHPDTERYFNKSEINLINL
jgi:uncharacterized protein YhaN